MGRSRRCVKLRKAGYDVGVKKLYNNKYGSAHLQNHYYGWLMSYWNPPERQRRRIKRKMARISRRINRHG
jgi:hypothetical protein